MSFSTNFKSDLYKACQDALRLRIETAKHAMSEAQNAANGEEKSSAGDKYETGRAMGHRDRDMYARQLAEAYAEWQKLEALNLEASEFIKSGSLVEVNGMNYFIAVAIGKIELKDEVVMVISRESPIAKLMLGKSLEDEFWFRDINWKINKIK